MIDGMKMAYSGKKYGNLIADFLGIHRGLFHTAMEEGGCEMHLIKLHLLKQEDVDIANVAYDSCEYLLRGLLELEIRFGKQALSEEALVKIKSFMISHENSASQSKTPIAGSCDESTGQPDSDLEHTQLLNALRESGALASCMLIGVMERNSDFFESNPALLSGTLKLLDAGLSFSEDGKHKMARNSYNQAISDLIDSNASMLVGDVEFESAFVRIKILQRDVIDRLMDKYENDF